MAAIGKFGIQDFYNVSQQREFARDFQFKLLTLGPLTEDDLIYVRTATLPGKSITNNVVKYMGLDLNVPGTTVYDGSAAWTVKFLCDEAHNVRSKLNAWATEIFDIETSTGKYGVPTEMASLALLDKSLSPIRKYNLVGTYVQKIGEIPYTIEGAGKPQEFDVTLSYQFWREVSV